MDCEDARIGRNGKTKLFGKGQNKNFFIEILLKIEKRKQSYLKNG